VKIKTAKNTLILLKEIGQSPWYDNIERCLVNNGGLKKLFETGLLGVTTNPTIFEKAVSGSTEYDQSIKDLSKKGKSGLRIYDTLTIEDVKKAAELLKNTYEKTSHLDGYVSIEVLPEFAHNAKKTIESAKEIFAKINMPNIMIKVPGTKESPEAVRELIKEGINVNVTLLFSVEHYEASAHAYIEGLKERLKNGKDISNVFSVASVFVSRVDTKLDKVFEEQKINDLKGKIAVANAKIIYQRFKEIFSGNKFTKLGEKGGHVQRVLWASTGTKNPTYNDVKYVEELIGPHTINTMPPVTVNAFLDHGKITSVLDGELDDVQISLKKLSNLGIDLDKVCQEIQDAGIIAFQVSFDKLIQSIQNKARS